MVRLYTDHQGKLQHLEAVPKQVEPAAAGGAAPFDWNLLLRAAGLDAARFQPAQPEWTPLAAFDERAAWTGTDPASGAALRVEAAAWRGKPVFFRIIGPWSKPERMEPGSANSGTQLAVIALIYTALISAGFIAWRHLRSGKGDYRGAFKLALVYGACLGATGLLAAHHTVTMDELATFWKTISTAVINGGVVWAFYLALEPWVRRSWPQTLISWSRCMTRGIRDPLVGRDILFGAGLGCAETALRLATLALHGKGGEPVMADLGTLVGVRAAGAAALQSWTSALFTAMFFFFILFVLRLVLRNQWLASAAFVVILTAVFGMGTSYPWVDTPANLLFAALYTVVLLRFGLLALVVTELVATCLLGVPRTLDFSSWYAAMGMAPLAICAALAFFGFRTSLGGRKLLNEEAL
jgi:hypothetical protein